MDYDVTSMPEGYDRGRSLSTGVIDEWLGLLERELGNDAVRNIVDLGCGTGRFSDALARHFRSKRAPLGRRRLEQRLTTGATISLPDEEFEAGLERIRAHAAAAPTSPVSEPINVFIFRAP